MNRLSSYSARFYYRNGIGGRRIDEGIRLGENLLRHPEICLESSYERLRALLRDAVVSVPRYRDLMRRGFDPTSVVDGDTLARLPIVTKTAMQDAPADFESNPLPPGSVRSQTGGSTGTPLSFWHDPGHLARMKIDLHRGYRWCGYRPGDRALFLWGSDYDSRAHRTFLGRLLDDFGHNRLWANAFRLGPKELDTVISHARRWRPEFLFAYATAATLLARHPGANEIAPFRGIQVTAELLTPTARSTIQDGLRGPVFNRYGCREVGNIAHECEARDGLHVFEDSHLVEVVGKDGQHVSNGLPGRVVVTNLTNRATPFVRYDLGDIARLQHGRCSCGRSGSRLYLIEGRLGEVVTSPSGKWIHGEFFTHLFYGVDGVRRFRVIQSSRRRLHIQIESDRPIAQAVFHFLDESIRNAADPEFEITFEQVAVIEPSPSGKYRFVESSVPLEVVH
jgi:phenylacetate-CoA ligase